MWRYRWAALAAAWVICLISWPIVAKLPDRYQASAQVFVDTEFVLPDVVGVGPLTDPALRLQAMSRTLLTRPNLEEIILKTDLDLGVSNTAETRNLVSVLRDNITISSGSRNDLYTIAYTHENPQLAKNVVQAVLTLFVEKTLRERGDSETRVEEFLDQRVAEKETELRDLENQLAAFKRENFDLMPATGQSYQEYISKLEKTIVDARLELQQAEKKRDNLQQELIGDVPSFGIGSDLDPTSAQNSGTFGAQFSFENFKTTVNTLPEQVRLANLEEQLDLLRVKFTDQHPDVVSLRELIPQLRGQVDVKLRGLYEEEQSRRALQNAQIMTQLNSSSDTYTNQLRLQNVDIQSRIDSLKIQIENAQNQLSKIREKRDLLPTIEAELRRYQSELSLAKQQLEDMKSRQKRVELGIKVGESEDIRFEVVEPPYVPPTPAGPYRAFLFPGALLVALGVGLALAFVIAQLRPTFDTRRSLATAFPVPVIGSVSGFWPSEKIRRARVNMVLYSLLTAGLFGLCGMLVWADLKGLKLPGLA